ncbi:MAG: hypothetical protein LBM87_07350 [Ruminococcus sp.]|jgi:hypothetical protein|nr:hypothetical protein [Ruminococcus sp.]
MKKVHILAVLAAFTMIMTGCNTTEDNNTPDTPHEITEGTPSVTATTAFPAGGNGETLTADNAGETTTADNGEPAGVPDASTQTPATEPGTTAPVTGSTEFIGIPEVPTTAAPVLTTPALTTTTAAPTTTTAAATTASNPGEDEITPPAEAADISDTLDAPTAEAVSTATAKEIAAEVASVAEGFENAVEASELKLIDTAVYKDSAVYLAIGEKPSQLMVIKSSDSSAAKKALEAIKTKLSESDADGAKGIIVNAYQGYTYFIMSDKAKDVETALKDSIDSSLIR